MGTICCIVYKPSCVLRHAVPQGKLVIATEVLMHNVSQSLVNVTYLVHFAETILWHCSCCYNFTRFYANFLSATQKSIIST